MKLKRLMTEPEYRKVPHISYSTLSGLDNSPYSLINREVTMTDALIYGSAVDTLVFDGREEFDKKFATIHEGKPTGLQAKLFDKIYDEIKIHADLGIIENDFSKYNDIILNTVRTEDFYKTWKDDTVITKMNEYFGNYFKVLVEAEGKLILSPEQYEYCVNSVNTLQTHEFTREYFDTSKEGVDVYFQFPIIWEYINEEGKIIHCKSLLDILIIDHNEKVIKPVDLKTTGKSVLSFPYSFIEWKYYLQAAFYTDAVIYLRDKLYPELSDYKVDLFKFVVISSKNPVKPLMFKVTQDTLDAGRKGGVIKATSNNVKGYKTLISDMIWHVDNDKYIYPRDVYESDGLIDLDLF